MSDSELVKKRGLTTVTINHGNFTAIHRSKMTLHGLVIFNHCSYSSIWINTYRSNYEPAPTEENVRSFQSYDVNKEIKLYKSQFYYLRFNFYGGIALKVSIMNCKSYSFVIDFVILYVDAENNASSLLLVQIDQSFVQRKISVWNHQEKSFLLINLFNSNMSNVEVWTPDDFKGKLALRVENVTWVNNNNKGFMKLRNVINVNIVSSQLILNCDACSPMIFHGLNIRNQSLEYYFRNDITNLKSDLPIVLMRKTVFKIHTKVQDRISTKKIKVILINSTFIIERIMYIDISIFTVSNIFIQCPTAKMARRISSGNHTFYECNPACERNNKYSPQAGISKISEPNDPSIIQLSMANLSLVEYLPSCLQCPLGAKCADGIQALPEYWGYKSHSEYISMMRCPDGYCCQGDDSCKGIDSCNTGRTGTLCGRCKQNLTEALFSSKCLPTESCRSGLVIGILILAVIIYAVALLSFSTIKDILTNCLKRVYIWCKGRSQQEKVKQNSTDEQQSKEDTATDDSGMKYMQLLFYYVEDSKLLNCQK